MKHEADELDQWLSHRFSSLSPGAGAIDTAFVEGVMRRIESTSRDLRLARQVVLSLALGAGLIIALMSLAAVDLSLLAGVQNLLAAALLSALGSPAWHWMAILAPLFWLTLSEA